jgi:hypothetical protein
MNMQTTIGLSGRYRLQTKKNGTVTRDSGWFKNLITNNGMNTITTNTTWSRYCSVGSSSSAPSFSDVALGSLIAATLNNSAPDARIEGAERYLGNIAEIGVGDQSDGTSLFSRALVRDSMGNPTTITVLADEDLVVIYELWVKQPTGDFPFNAGGVTGTIRACRVDDITPIASSRNLCWRFSGSANNFIIPSGNGYVILFSGAMSAITSYPGGDQQSASLTPTMAAYTPGSHTRVGTVTFSTTLGNSAPIKSIGWVFGCTCWQLELDTEINKTNLQTLRLGFQLSWSRDNGPA